MRLQGDGYLLMAFTRCNAPDRLEDWNDWYDEAHVPSLLKAGADWVTRFELSQQPVPGMPSIGFSHVAIYEFKGEGAEARLDETLRLNMDLQTRREIHPHHCLINVDVLKAHGAAGSKSEPAHDLEGHILAYVMPNQPDRESEWDAWVDSVHLPDMMDSGAFRAGSRWRRRSALAYGANDLTLYDVAGHEIHEAVSRSAAVMPELASRGRKLDCHVGGMSFTVRSCGQYGGAGVRAGASGFGSHDGGRA
jgi:hypothetical protein